jgi:phosphatidylglycerol:prolipoprotein diacylglycerol transferase
MTMLGAITINIDPVFLHLGGFKLHWYGIMYAVAFTMGWTYGARPYALSHGISKETAEKALFTTIIAGLIGARLYYVIQQPNLGHFFSDPIQIIAVWNGGMAFFGAIIASALVFLWFGWKGKCNFWTLFDAGVFFAVVGQPFGRIGNIINGDILGSPSTVPWATVYTNPNAILQSCCHLGQAYQPAAAYEALGTIVIGVILLALLKTRRPAPGVLAITYVAGYAISQILIFFLRDSEPVIGLGLKQAQWTGLVILLIGVPLMILARRKWGTAADVGATAPPAQDNPAAQAARNDTLEPV